MARRFYRSGKFSGNFMVNKTQINFQIPIKLKQQVDEHLHSNNTKQVDFFISLLIDFFASDTNKSYPHTELLQKKENKIRVLESKIKIITKKHDALKDKIQKLINK